MNRRLPLLSLLFLAACAGQSFPDVALCREGGRLSVGVVGADGADAEAVGAMLTAPEQFQLRELLTVASRCEVQLEPVLSPEQARLRLSTGDWDMAFLPPGLGALALEQRGGYGLVRQLGRRTNSRSQLLVRAGSPLRHRADLAGKRLGLLPRGSLTGFYLPLFNLRGLRLASVQYALSYAELREMLASGRVDVIAWDGAIPLHDPGLRVLHEDARSIPMGALAFSQSLLKADHQPFLSQLDQNVTQLPPSLGYASGVIPSPVAMTELRGIVAAVEGWSLPLAGRPYRVFGARTGLAADRGGSR